jgi:hypothetical protein
MSSGRQGDVRISWIAPFADEKIRIRRTPGRTHLAARSREPGPTRLGPPPRRRRAAARSPARPRAWLSTVRGASWASARLPVTGFRSDGILAERATSICLSSAILEGDLELVPIATDGGARHVELRGRVKPNSLLVAQEAVGRGVLPPPTVLSDRDESSVASAACPRLARSRRCSETDSARPRL